MRILVFVKTVVEPQDPQWFSNPGYEMQGVGDTRAYLNPPDRCALEEALRMKDRLGGQVTAVSLGGDPARQGLRECLARGAGRAIHLPWKGGYPPQGLDKALLLAQAARQEPYDLILCGEKSLDGGSGATGPMLAEILDLPQITGVSRIEITSGGIIAERALERGSRSRVACPLPAMITVTGQINTPHYVSVFNQKFVRLDNLKTIEVMPPSSPIVDTGSIQWGPPSPRPRKVQAPSSSLPAANRISFLLSGGHASQAKKDERIFEGSAEEAAKRIVSFLEEKGLLM